MISLPRKLLTKILHRWTSQRITKAVYSFSRLIPKQDLERIDFLLATFIVTKDTSKTAEAGAGVLENGEYFVVFFLPHLWYKSTDDLLLTVAHEFAHVFLEHKPKNVLPEEAEEAVHKQLKIWGTKDEYYEFISHLRKEYPTMYKFLSRKLRLL
jgi:hypothetical protein